MTTENHSCPHCDCALTWENILDTDDAWCPYCEGTLKLHWTVEKREESAESEQDAITLIDLDAVQALGIRQPDIDAMIRELRWRRDSHAALLAACKTAQRLINFAADWDDESSSYWSNCFDQLNAAIAAGEGEA